MKKTFVLILTLLLLLTVGAAAQENVDRDKIIDVVRLLEIMNGDENGNLNLSVNVTRSEFVKMAICASTYKSAADTAPKNSLFPDVRSNHWAARYINVAITNGWINGYLDGTFRPDDNVKLEEAVNIVLKVLGYTESDLAGAYPEPQMANYTSLKLNKYMTSSVGEALTREDCMYLIYNMLNTKNKNGTVHAQTLGYSLDSNDIIDYLSVVDDNTDGPVIALNDWRHIIGISAEKAVVWRDGKTASIDEIKDYDVLYYSKLINTVWAYSQKEFGVLQAVSSVASPSTVTISGKTYSLGNSDVKYKFSTLGEFAKDDIIVVLLGADNQVEYAFDVYEVDYNIFVEDETDYVLLTQYSLEDPFIAQDGASWKAKIPFDTSTARIFRNGEASNASAVQKYDVIYYSDLLKAVWCYDNKKSGIVDGVSPTKSAPTAITLSGVNYTIASDSVAFSLSELGTISSGDVVTLLLGRDNMVEGIITADAADSSMYLRGDLNYEKIVNSSLEGPYIVNGNSHVSQIGFDLSGASIYRNDEAATAADISEWDIYYYSKPLKTVWVYSKKVSGKYESALPDKSAPTSVVVSGKTYAVETSGVAHRLSSAGNFAIGDNITLLLGKSGGIAGVVSADDFSTEVIGVVTDFYSKEYDTTYGGTYSSNCVVVSDLDGNSMEYATNMTYIAKGRMVSVKTSSSGTKISIISKNYTNVKDLNSAMKEGKYAVGAQIADMCGSSLVPLYTSRLDGCTLDAADVLYYKLNSDGEVTILVLNDYTGDNHSYVMLKSVVESMTTRNTSGRYSYIGESGEGVLTGNAVFGVERGPSAIEYSGNTISNIQNLSTSVVLDSVGALSALAGNITYEVWDKALILEYSSGDYRVINMADIESGDKYVLTGWLDKAPSRGGMIRVIVASPKK